MYVCMFVCMCLQQVSMGELANLTFSQLGTKGCVASAVDTFALQSLQFNLSQVITYIHSYIDTYIHT